MTGRKILPPKEGMLQDLKAELKDRRSRGFPKSKAHLMGETFQDKYYADLAILADIEPIKPVVLNILTCSGNNYLSNFDTFRNYNFKVIDDENFEVSYDENPSHLNK